MRTLSSEELSEITAHTVAHYDQAAASFWEGTKDHDVSQNIEAMLRHIKGQPPYRILDFGCGPGRDLIDLVRRGHNPVGLEGSTRLCEMARERSGCEVWHQNFLALDLPDNCFDAVFANASLFHVPKQEVPHVLSELSASLKPAGVLFSSNPRGYDKEGWSGDRYGSFHSLPAWRELLEAAGLVELEHYYRPAGLPRDQQPWLATVWRRVQGQRG